MTATIGGACKPHGPILIYGNGGEGIPMTTFCYLNEAAMLAALTQTKLLLWWKGKVVTREIMRQVRNNTPGTAGGPGGRDRTLAVKSRKTAENQLFFFKKLNLPYFFFAYIF